MCTERKKALNPCSFLLSLCVPPCGSEPREEEEGDGDSEWLLFDDTRVGPYDVSRLAEDCFGGRRPAERERDGGGAGEGETGEGSQESLRQGEVERGGAVAGADSEEELEEEEQPVSRRMEEADEGS